MTSLLEQLAVVETRRYPLWKYFFWHLEGMIGSLVYKKPPPRRDGARLLHLGCQDQRVDGWVNADYYRFHNLIFRRFNKPDWMLDIARAWNCPDDHWDGVFSSHTLEHMTYSGAITALRESYRTLKAGCWLRLVLPDLSTCHEAYVEAFGSSDVEIDPAIHRAPAVSHLAQNNGHRSVWDVELLARVLRDVGFAKVHEASFGSGADQRLVIDPPHRRIGSLFADARKPIA